MASAKVLTSSTTTYEFPLGAIEQLIANDLGVAVTSIKVEFVIQEVGADPMDRHPGHPAVTKVRVTHNLPYRPQQPT